MKFVIASDIHGSAFWCRKLMEVVEAEQPDQLLLLGDLLYHGPRNDLPRDYAPKQVIDMLSGQAHRILCVRDMLEAGEEYGAKWYCAGAITKKGHPHHPLYLRQDEKIKPFDVKGYLEKLV